ncbi:Oxysterol-binding protein-related protein 2 [Nymphon striatum]|nr:Oxysterol-binding protein-related protein 2 [Nymphon striatum]
MSQTQPFQFEPKYATDEEGEESLSSSQSNSEDDEKASRIGEQSWCDLSDSELRSLDCKYFILFRLKQSVWPFRQLHLPRYILTKFSFRNLAKNLSFPLPLETYLLSYLAKFRKENLITKRKYYNDGGGTLLNSIKDSSHLETAVFQDTDIYQLLKILNNSTESKSLYNRLVMKAGHWDICYLNLLTAGGISSVFLLFFCNYMNLCLHLSSNTLLHLLLVLSKIFELFILSRVHGFRIINLLQYLTVLCSIFLLYVFTNSAWTCLPVPMFCREEISVWSVLKQCIGKELSKITMPVVLNEPLSFLQRLSEYMEYSYLLTTANQCDDPVMRIEYVTAFAVSALASNWERLGKPFNPLLGETFELQRPDIGFRIISEQVSHHPPVSAFHADSSEFTFKGSIHPKLKFWGKSVEIQPKGTITVELLKHNEVYTWTNVNCCVHNIIVGKLWIEQYGLLEVVNHQNGLKAVLNFKPAGWFSRDLHRIEGFIVNKEKKKLRFVYGKWTDYLKSSDIESYEEYMKTHSHKFKPPDVPSPSSGRSPSGTPAASPAHQAGKKLQAKFRFNSFTRHLSQSSSTEQSTPVSFNIQSIKTVLIMLEDQVLDSVLHDGIKSYVLVTTTKSVRLSYDYLEHIRKVFYTHGSVESFQCEIVDRSRFRVCTYNGIWMSHPSLSYSNENGSCDSDSDGGIPKSDSTYSLDISNSQMLWKCEPRPEDSAKYYQFTLFAMMLNELESDNMKKNLYHSDSRLRPDIRKLEEGDIDGAAAEKNRLEEKQREARKLRKKLKTYKDWKPRKDSRQNQIDIKLIGTIFVIRNISVSDSDRWFHQTKSPYSNSIEWTYIGGYWDRDNSEKIDIF